MFHNSFLNLELLITFFLQLFVARTLVPDNASYDNQCHRRHQHQTVVNVAAKIEKAIRLSQEKYCGVGLMMKKIGPITYDILLNGEPLKPQKHED